MKIKYFEEINQLLLKTEARDKKGKAMPLDKAVSKVVKLVSGQSKKGRKTILIGNGGSASIASHIATDFLKNCRISSIAFNDASLITCLSNDLGYESVYEEPIKRLAKKGDMLFSISSSGRSKNIINAAKSARAKGCLIVTFSGFSKNNPLRKLGDVNFYVPSYSYGFVEIIHLVICHLISDSIQYGHVPHR